MKHYSKRCNIFNTYLERWFDARLLSVILSVIRNRILYFTIVYSSECKSSFACFNNSVNSEISGKSCLLFTKLSLAILWRLTSCGTLALYLTHCLYQHIDCRAISTRTNTYNQNNTTQIQCKAYLSYYIQPVYNGQFWPITSVAVIDRFHYCM